MFIVTDAHKPKLNLRVQLRGPCVQRFCVPNPGFAFRVRPSEFGVLPSMFCLGGRNPAFAPPPFAFCILHSAFCILHFAFRISIPLSSRHSFSRRQDNVATVTGSSTRLAYLAWISVCLVWGTTYLAIRIALESIPPALVGGLRFTAAGVVLALVLWLRGERLPGREHWPGLALLGALMLGVGNGFVVWAEQWVPSGLAAVIIASSPFWMAAVEAVLPDGERFSPRMLAGMIVGFAGILVLVWPDLFVGGDFGRQFLFGVIAIQLAEIGWALGSSYSKRQARHENALAASAVQMIFGGVLMLMVATWRGEWVLLSFTPRTLAAEVYLVVFGSFAGYSAYIYALKHLPVSTVSLYAYVNPVIAVILGTLVLDEPFGLRIVVGAAIVFCGIAVVRTGGSRLQGPGLRAQASGLGRAPGLGGLRRKPGSPRALGPDS